MDDFTNAPPRTSRRPTQIDDGTTLKAKEGAKKTRQQLQIRFPYKQIAVVNVLRAILSTRKSPYGARVP